ncbi:MULTISPECIES: bifunctional oligoribonuclease/PAP phosphatase NrnA [Haloferax]|uniref:Bifunctional oligoribonuclease/PAP phosphatase NrnA n=2 Tax=Haloferax TaxID=2251 RepID=A0A6G1Z0F2_9EURY|nr:MULTISPECIES: bifunctional oligoribonuclease/PAP phosphatase NrnA [Haloferax]KAB1187420.1 bifunctional oligoribonuclease/PAP phosphatase NrnA [Haloferax sp. CBA1149]MRW80069.1 bifunctional oligoribonuclease/PAP phosphatase NrnA [Haloferax marinisediminis]
MSTPQQLHELLSGGSELNIVCHNNPDPDCLASALALGRIAEAAGVEESHILYDGDISHQQNRAFVNLLGIELEQFDPATVTDRPPGSLLAFVDHSVPGANNKVPKGTPIDIVIDHHPSNGVDARFVDHRDHVGAAATILTEYIQDLDIELDEALATALLFAIRRETLNFLRGVTSDEYEAAAYLQKSVDNELLHQLSAPSFTGETLDAIATAIGNRRVKQSVLISHVGRTTERDSLPQAADYLATLEGVETAIIFGIIHDAIHLSARSPDPRIHAGNVLRKAFGDVGSAGGHHDVAGGEIPLGIFADYKSDDEQLLRILEEVITTRLYAELNINNDSKK